MQALPVISETWAGASADRVTVGARKKIAGRVDPKVASDLEHVENVAKGGFNDGVKVRNVGALDLPGVVQLGRPELGAAPGLGRAAP